MKLHFETGSGRHTIRAYAPGQVTINDTVYQHSLIVLPEQLIPDWPPQDWTHLEPGHIGQIVALRPEIVLIGTGHRRRQPPARVLDPLSAAGLGWELMDTGAACRTYNILMGEGRRVAAALMMIES